MSRSSANYLYVANYYNNGLEIFDISNPAKLHPAITFFISEFWPGRDRDDCSIG